MSATGDLVVVDRANLVYNYTRTTGRAGQRRTIQTQDRNVSVIYSVNNQSGAVTVYLDDGRNLDGQTTTSLAGQELAVWSPARGGGGEWREIGQSGRTIPTDAAVDPTWDQLAGDLFSQGQTNGTYLQRVVTHAANELPSEDRQNIYELPGVTPVETLDETAGTDGENDSRPTVRRESEVIAGTGAFFESFTTLRYPSELPLNVSDLIQFQIVEYKTLSQSSSSSGVTPDAAILSPTDSNNTISGGLFTGGRGRADATKADVKGTINLAIQPPVTDNNGVNWTDTGVNLVQLGLASLSAGFIENSFGGANANAQKILDTTSKDGQTIKKALTTFFAGKAAQTNNLLSRLTGSVLNPNLETLFEGPRTRSFNYQFQFTPRSESEAVEVRNIIRAFKEAMAVKRTSGLSFLLAPYVFNIRYLYKGGDDHPYIGRVKGPCALKDMQTDYAPEGSYMTYEGGENGGSMVKYTVTMVFQELDPVYADDYTELGDNVIGY